MKNTYFALVLILVCFYSQTYAQNQQVLDSLNHIYKSALHDSTKILAMADIAYLYYLQFDTCLELAEKGIELSEKIGYEKGKGRCYSAISASYYRAKDNYFVALSYAQKSLEITEKHNDLKGQTDALNMIAMTHFSLKNYEQALTYFQRCLKVAEQNKSMLDFIANTINMGMILEKQKKYPQALEMLLKIIPQAKKLNNEYEGYALSNIGNIYLEQNQLDSAIYYFTQSTHIGEKFNDLYLQATALVGLGKAYQKQNQYEKAIQYAEKTLVIANQINLLTEKKDAYAVLYEVYKKQADYAQAMQYLELFKQANDSLTNTEKAKSVANLENKMNLENKDKELALLKAEQTQKDTEQQFWLFLVSGGFIFMFVFALFVFRSRNKIKDAHTKISSAHLEIQKQKGEIQVAYGEIQTSNEELQQTQEEILAQRDLLENKNNLLIATYEKLKLTTEQLDQSIQYASNVQSIVMPEEAEIRNFFSDAFIIFRPKDVVSGDFYWFSQISNEIAVFSLSDCTGHGVPGAFMSMLGSMILNEIVNIKKNYDDPALILKNTHQSIRKILKQDKKKNSDGMDISICVFQKNIAEKTIHFTFAGAKSNMAFIVDNQIIDLKGDRQYLGGTELQNDFTNHHFILPENTQFYLFTDGYQDQNNDSRQKIGKAKLKEELLNCSLKTFQEQKEYLEFVLVQHQKAEEQRDDISVIGLKI